MSEKRFIHVNIHDFKTNISRYIRALEAKRAPGIIVRRRGEPIGVFALLPEKKED